MSLRPNTCTVYSIFMLIALVNLPGCSALDHVSRSTYSFPFSDDVVIKDTTEQILVKAVLHGAIIPWHNDLKRDLDVLNEKAERFCIQPTIADSERLKQAWLNAMRSWSSVGVFNFGPIDDLNIRRKFQFWPDSLNEVHSKFESRLAGTNLAISETELADASAAIQGLSAVEYLLYDEHAGQLDTYRSASHKCQILMGTTHNLVKEARTLVKEWNTQYKKAWQTVQTDSSTVFVASELPKSVAGKHHLETILNGMLSHLSHLKDRKLAIPLGIKSDEIKAESSSRKLNVRRLESWRSETSLLHIKRNLMSMETLYIMPEGFSWYLLENLNNTVLDQKIKALFTHIFEQIYTMEHTAEQQISSHNTVALKKLYDDVDALFKLMRYDYMSALSLRYRFAS